eukprot:913835-Pelagomonas_calceolata.AAC.1
MASEILEIRAGCTNINACTSPLTSTFADVHALMHQLVPGVSSTSAESNPFNSTGSGPLHAFIIIINDSLTNCNSALLHKFFMRTSPSAPGIPLVAPAGHPIY